MQIVHIAPELAPVAKVGGLADVVLGLARELTAQGHKVEVILPKYDCLLQREITDLKICSESIKTQYDGETYTIRAWSGTVQGVSVIFLEAFAPRSFFSHGCVYGATEDIDRFCYFSRVVLDFLLQTKRHPDILHIHDWPTALVAPLLRERYADTPLAKAKTVFTIHNFDYQGQCSPENIEAVGLNGIELLQSGKMSDNVKPGLINLMKGAIVYCDFFTTVSPTYAQEVLTPKEGRHMESTIYQFHDKFQGILNGIDYDYWNPETDPRLVEHFSLQHLSSGRWNGKAKAKLVLQERLNLELENRPIVSFLSLIHI